MSSAKASLPRRQFLKSAAAVLTFPQPDEISPAEPAWLWSGAVTARSATVLCSFRGLPNGAPMLLVSERQSLAEARRVEGTTIAAPSRRDANRFVVRYELTGLSPNQEYYGGFVPASGTRVRLRTFGAGPYSFLAAFASCAGGTRVVPMSHVSNTRLFDAISALDPHVFIHMGDLHYYNLRGAPRPIETMAGRFRRSLDRVLSQEHQALLYRRTPIVYTWDDHDYGRDGSDASSPTRDGARAYYATDIPHYPLPLSANADGPIAQRFEMGRVRFLVTDCRSERNPGQRTMLGQRQFSWLFEELGQAARDQVPLLVWVNSVPWIIGDGDPEGWGPFAAERQALGQRVTQLALGRRLLMLSGDAHMLAFDDGRHNPHGGFVVAQAAPLDRFVRRKGGPYSHEPPDQKNGQFATLQVEDSGATLIATLQGYRHLGAGRAAPVPETRLRLRCAGGRCEILTS